MKVRAKRVLLTGLAATAPVKPRWKARQSKCQVTQSLAVQAGGFDRTIHPQAHLFIFFFVELWIL